MSALTLNQVSYEGVSPQIVEDETQFNTTTAVAFRSSTNLNSKKGASEFSDERNSTISQLRIAIEELKLDIVEYELDLESLTTTLRESLENNKITKAKILENTDFMKLQILKYESSCLRKTIRYSRFRIAEVKNLLNDLKILLERKKATLNAAEKVSLLFISSV